MYILAGSSFVHCTSVEHRNDQTVMVHEKQQKEEYRVSFPGFAFECKLPERNCSSCYFMQRKGAGVKSLHVLSTDSNQQFVEQKILQNL